MLTLFVQINAILGMPHELKSHGMRRSPRQSRPDAGSLVSSDPLDDEDTSGLEPLSTFDVRFFFLTQKTRVRNCLEREKETEMNKLSVDLLWASVIKNSN